MEATEYRGNDVRHPAAQRRQQRETRAGNHRAQTERNTFPRLITLHQHAWQCSVRLSRLMESFCHDPRDLNSPEAIGRNNRPYRPAADFLGRRGRVAGAYQGVRRLLSARAALHARARAQMARKAWRPWSEPVWRDRENGF